ncbi:uncharacterized protein LOC144218634 [Crocuta crocuta]
MRRTPAPPGSARRRRGTGEGPGDGAAPLTCQRVEDPGGGRHGQHLKCLLCLPGSPPRPCQDDRHLHHSSPGYNHPGLRARAPKELTPGPIRFDEGKQIGEAQEMESFGRKEF